MKRIIGALAGTAAIALSCAAGAQAATPTAVTLTASDVTDTTAVVHARVDPEGAVTDYTFNYGPTPSYGAATVARSSGTGTKSVGVADEITGLEPGTTYHYQVTATSAAGTATGADATFTTTGVAPSGASTGPAVDVHKYSATLTATVIPGSAATSYQFQYGTTPNLGLETYGAAGLVAGSAGVPVSAVIGGLAPAQLFYYRIVSYHGALPSYGAEGSFFTEPGVRPSPDLSTSTKPARDTRAPYRFTTTGTLRGGSTFPAAQRCSGTVAITYANDHRRLAYVVADVGSNCRFSGAVTFRRTHGSGSVPLSVTVDYRGNGYLRSETKTDHIHAG